MSGPDRVQSKDTGSSFTPHPEAQYASSCVDVIDLGLKLEQYQGQDAREVHKIALVFATGETNAEGFLHTISQEFTNSLHEKANLRRFLESWRGKSYTDDQARAGIELHKLYQQPALIVVEHQVSKRGRTFARIASITPLPKQMEPPDVVAYERAEFWAERKKEYQDQIIRYRSSVGAYDEAPYADTGQPEDEVYDDDPLPF